MPKFKGLINSIGQVINKQVKAISKHSPEILVSLGVAGFIGSVIATAKVATPRYEHYIEDKKDELDVDILTKREKAECIVKAYWPIALGVTASSLCVLSAFRINAKRNAALAVALKVSEEALQDYRDSVESVANEEDKKRIKEEYKTRRLAKGNDIYKSTDSNMKKAYCFEDTLTHQRCWKTYNQIEAAKNEFNNQLLSEDNGSLNEWLDYLDLEHQYGGDELIWNIGKGMISLYFESIFDEDEGYPVTYIRYNREPDSRIE